MRRFLAIVALLMGSSSVHAQGFGQVVGRVLDAQSGEALAYVRISVPGTGAGGATNAYGRFSLPRVGAGKQTIDAELIGYKTKSTAVTVVSGDSTKVEIRLDRSALTLAGLDVHAAHGNQAFTQATGAAETQVAARDMKIASITGQAPLALANVPGLDIVQSGVNDFNVNARGFNSVTNRRVAVFQDGRDLGTPLLGSQEWNTLTMPFEEMGKVSVIRGPASAIYGPNAFSGVIDITTPLVREAVGGKISLAGGELSTRRADVRYGGLIGSGRWGYRFNVGSSSSDSWTRSRTLFDSSSLINEYAGISGANPPRIREVVPLAGQTMDTLTGAPLGKRDPVSTEYSTLRLDRYSDRGSIMTLEGGVSRTRNEVTITPLGRMQVPESERPWARLRLSGAHSDFQGYWNGRIANQDQINLSTGEPFSEQSGVGQVQMRRFGDRGSAHWTVGGSVRVNAVNSLGTLMPLEDDRRSDFLSSVYSQMDWHKSDSLTISGALRFDKSGLFGSQLSPRIAFERKLAGNRIVRFSYGRGFQTPNYLDLHLRGQVGPVTDGPWSVEQQYETMMRHATSIYSAGIDYGLLINQLNLPHDLPWNFTRYTPQLAFGDSSLKAEDVHAFETGMRWTNGSKNMLSMDLFYNIMRNFTTDYLAGVNPKYPTFALKDGATDLDSYLDQIEKAMNTAGMPANHPLRAELARVRAAYDQIYSNFGDAFVTLPNEVVMGDGSVFFPGQKAILFAKANIGRVDDYGGELSGSHNFDNGVRLDATYTFTSFFFRENRFQGLVPPNTPKQKATASFSYGDRGPVQAVFTTRFSDSYQWASGTFRGIVPVLFNSDASLGWKVKANTTATLVATNVLNQRSYQMFGGSVIGRRILGGVSFTF